MLATDKQREQLVNFFKQGTKLTFEKGEFIVKPGAAPSGVLYVKAGLVKAYDITKYGEENLLIIRKPGEIIGLTWTITGENRHIMYAALAPTTLLLVNRDQVTDFLHNNSQAALPLVDLLVDMYKTHSERVLNLEYRTVRERLISFLFTYAKRFGKQTDAGLVIQVPLRHQDIASSISATRETTGRALSALEKQGLLASKQSILTLKDTTKLRKYLEN